MNRFCGGWHVRNLANALSVPVVRHSGLVEPLQLHSPTTRSGEPATQPALRRRRSNRPGISQAPWTARTGNAGKQLASRLLADGEIRPRINGSAKKLSGTTDSWGRNLILRSLGVVMRAHLDELVDAAEFTRRHSSPTEAERAHMLGVIGEPSIEALLAHTVPQTIRMTEGLALGEPRSPESVLGELRQLAGGNVARTSLIGMGYYGTITPPVIVRNVLENPAWYTAYTPYQPEISQGRLEALLNFQTMVAELTGFDLANASLLDEATAAAEAMTMARRLSKSDSDRFIVHRDTHPQTIAVLATRAEPVGIDLVVGEVADVAGGCFGALFSLPTSSGAIVDWTAAVAEVHEVGGLAIVATDLLACMLTVPPAQLGADIADRFRTTIWRFDGLRWSARGLHSRLHIGRPRPARTSGRRQHRYRGASRAPPRPADPRAAHPAREGDLQHLHRPGTAGQHRRLLRGLARPGGPSADRRASAPAHIAGCGRAAGRRSRLGQRHVVRHVADPMRCSRRAGSGCCRWSRSSPCRRAHHRPQFRRNLGAVDGAGRACRVRGRHRDRRHGDGGPAESSHRRVLDPVRVLPISHRTRDASLPPPPGRQGSRPRSDHDPTGLVHDEAQRHRRDGAADLAWSGRHAPLLSGWLDNRHPRDDHPTRDHAAGNHRIRRGELAAQRREPGRVRRPVGNSCLPPQSRRIR